MPAKIFLSKSLLKCTYPFHPVLIAHPFHVRDAIFVLSSVLQSGNVQKSLELAQNNKNFGPTIAKIFGTGNEESLRNHNFQRRGPIGLCFILKVNEVLRLGHTQIFISTARICAEEGFGRRSTVRKSLQEAF